MPDSYYPMTNDGRADWWQNISENTGLFESLGFSEDDVSAITLDAAWGVYLYRRLRTAFDELHSAVIAYADAITDGSDGGELPSPVTVPGWPTVPAGAGMKAGIEQRRIKWVQRAKDSPTYNASVGAQLKLEAGGTPWNPDSYVAELFGLHSPSASTVAGKFRKAGGKIDGINLYGRKEGTAEWKPLGRFNATPFSALVPLAPGGAPEAWEFRARAVKRDVEIGVASTIVQLIVRG